MTPWKRPKRLKRRWMSSTFLANPWQSSLRRRGRMLRCSGRMERKRWRSTRDRGRLRKVNHTDAAASQAHEGNANETYQSANKPSKPPSKPPRNGRPQTALPSARPKRPKQQQHPPPPPAASFPTNTYRRTKSSSCAKSPKTTAKRLWRRSSAGFRGTKRCARCRGGTILPLWSMRMRKGRLQRGRGRRKLRWETG